MFFDSIFNVSLHNANVWDSFVIFIYKFYFTKISNGLNSFVIFIYKFYFTKISNGLIESQSFLIHWKILVRFYKDIYTKFWSFIFDITDAWWLSGRAVVNLFLIGWEYSILLIFFKCCWHNFFKIEGQYPALLAICLINLII